MRIWNRDTPIKTVCFIHEADGLYQAVPIPYPHIFTRFKVNGTAVKLNSTHIILNNICEKNYAAISFFR